MSTKLNPYLSFDGTAQQAMEFYRDVFGGELSLMPFSAMPTTDGSDAPEGIMHAQLDTPGGFTLMASDSAPGQDAVPRGVVSVSLSGDDADDLMRWFEALSEGGTIMVPLGEQMWGDTFGMSTDRFGINWLVNIAKVATTA